MSIEALHWALEVPVGGNEKVILLGLANHAHPDGKNAFPTLSRLAMYAHCDRSTARRNLRKLEKAGWIERHGEGPNGQSRWSLALDLNRGSKTPPLEGGSKTPPPSEIYPGGVAAVYPGGVAPVPPEPSVEPSTNQQVEANASTKVEIDPEAIRLCGVLASLMRENEPKVALPERGTQNHNAWIRDMRLLIRKDRGGNVAEVEAVIRWCQADDFWKSNIESPAKLRKQFSRLKMQSTARAVADGLQGTPAQRARFERTQRRLRVINGAADQPTTPQLEEHNGNPEDNGHSGPGRRLDAGPACAG